MASKKKKKKKKVHKSLIQSCLKEIGGPMWIETKELIQEVLMWNGENAKTKKVFQHQVSRVTLSNNSDYEANDNLRYFQHFRQTIKYSSC